MRRELAGALLVVLAACGGGGDDDDDAAISATSVTSLPAQSSTSTTTAVPELVRWEYDGSGWRAAGEPPPCDALDALPAPTDLDGATSVLYPGQPRGGDYKPHGGFRFDGAATQDLELHATIDGYLSRVSHYLEGGDVQYLVEIVNSCGLMVRFDHIATPSADLKAVFDALPPPQPDDSRTTNVEPSLELVAGDVIATAVGHPGNVAYDFGVYDLRQPNGSVAPPGELSSFAICWLDLVPGARELPPGDPASGTASDYCT